MNKNTKMIALVVAVVALLGFGGLAFTMRDTDSNADTAQRANTQQTSDQNRVVQQPVEITFSEDKKTVSYQGREGLTALEVLRQLTEVETKTESFGEFVTGINGLVADSTKEYWAFYVNGEYANEGAGTYRTKKDEIIEWKLEAITQ